MENRDFFVREDENPTLVRTRKRTHAGKTVGGRNPDRFPKDRRNLENSAL